MRAIWAAALCGVLVGCGPGIDTTPPEPGGEGDGNCTSNCEQKSLWPMTQGSRWKYRITDPVRGVFDKEVTVIGQKDVTGRSGLSAALFRSVQPHLEEHSYQIQQDGLVKRVREEDLKDPVGLVRVMTWSPDTIKALASPRPVGWTNQMTVNERVEDLVTGTVEVKEKLFLWTVVAEKVPVTIAGQTYEALKVKRDREDKDGKERFYWFVPGIGKVREEGERTEELIEFDVKP